MTQRLGLTDLRFSVARGALVVCAARPRWRRDPMVGYGGYTTTNRDGTPHYIPRDEMRRPLTRDELRLRGAAKGTPT